MRNKKLIIIISLVLLIFISSYLIFKNNHQSTTSFFEVKRGDIIEKVYETGQVKNGEKLNLNFKNTGRIAEIYIKVGDEVVAGQKLAKLDTSDLEIQLEQARLSLESAQLNLAKLVGRTNEQTVLKTAEENLKNSYQSAITVLDAAYPPIYQSLTFFKTFIQTYINTQDEEARKILGLKETVETQEKTAKEILDNIKQDSTNYSLIDESLLAMKSCLEITFNSLETLRYLINNSSYYRSTVSTTDQNLLETYKNNLNSIINQLIGLQEIISSSKLNLKNTQIDINLYQNQIKQAQAQIQLYENQINEAILISPVKGRVAEIKKRVGELVQSLLSEPMVIIIPDLPYEIKVDIYEENIVKINVGNPVEISLPAFPDRIYKGKVLAINPAEKIIGDVVYYEVTIGFEDFPSGLKPGMTADVAIQTAFKENVLIIPRSAIQKKDNKTIVRVLKDKTIEEREITIGLRGVDEMVEVLSGLQENEKIILD